MLINICAFHLVHLRELLCCRQDVAHTIEDNADSLVILGGEQIAEGLEHTLAAQVDDLRHLSSVIKVWNYKDSNQEQYRAATGQVCDRPCSLLLCFEVALKKEHLHLITVTQLQNDKILTLTRMSMRGCRTPASITTYWPKGIQHFRVGAIPQVTWI